MMFLVHPYFKFIDTYNGHSFLRFPIQVKLMKNKQLFHLCGTNLQQLLVQVDFRDKV